MYRKISVLLLVLMLVLFAGQMHGLAAETEKVKDTLGLLKEDELKEVQLLIDGAVKDYGLDVVIVTTGDTEGKSSRDFADDYYDYNGFGVGSDKSGLLLLINMKERELWISTTGKAIDIFTDARVSDMVSTIGGFLSKADYYNSCKEFIGKVRFYADQGVPEGQHRVDTEAPEGQNPVQPPSGGQGTGKTPSVKLPPVPPATYLERVARQVELPAVYIVAGVIALIATVIASSSSKGKITINSQTYEQDGSFKLTATSDDYIRETTTRVRVENDSDRSGGTGGGSHGSSTHSGSSGTTHGGGGGKF